MSEQADTEMTMEELQREVDKLQRRIGKVQRGIGRTQAQGNDPAGVYFDVADVAEHAGALCHRINEHGRARDARRKAELEAQTGRYVEGEILRGDSGYPLAGKRPGVFDYSGFGYGHLYLPEGRIKWCSRSEARETAGELGLEWVSVDRLQGFVSGDRSAQARQDAEQARQEARAQ